MTGLPSKLQDKILERTNNGSLRQLNGPNENIDFSSNDYLGFSKSESIFDRAGEILVSQKLKQNGATGSRLLSGNHQLYQIAENQIAHFHKSDAALIFNSGYDANVGVFSSIPQRGDVILFDELCHASIRDGIRMSHAKAYKYAHNDYKSLESLCQTVVKNRLGGGEIYIVTESVFSMDGDSPDLQVMVELAKKYGARCIVDEAHALGILGEKGEGMVQELNLQDAFFARIITFGKALGCHGAVVLGKREVIDYLINFARSFVYTTGLPPHTIATVSAGYEQLATDSKMVKELHHNIAILRNEIKMNNLDNRFIASNSAIHSMVIPSNRAVKEFADFLCGKGFDVKPILSPTVPIGEERLRICLHSFNSENDIRKLVQHLAIFAA
ncbi:MAG: pyridoxal phosphate-dependent aminotransferase family protein [Aureisphaera sp.]